MLGTSINTKRGRNAMINKEDYKGINEGNLSSWYVHSAKIPIFTNTLRFEFETV